MRREKARAESDLDDLANTPRADKYVAVVHRLGLSIRSVGRSWSSATIDAVKKHNLRLQAEVDCLEREIANEW